MFHLDLQMTANTAASFFLYFLFSFFPEGNMQAGSKNKPNAEFHCGGWKGTVTVDVKYIWLYNVDSDREDIVILLDHTSDPSAWLQCP